MRRCDTARVPSMTPLHDRHLETPLSPLTNRPHGVVHYHAVFLVSEPRRRLPGDWQAQSRPRAAIDTGSPVPITR